MLEISDQGVFNFVEDSDYPSQLYKFLNSYGYEIAYSELEYPKNMYYMAWGTSPRELYHSVICKNGDFIHDPHPDKGWVKDINRYVWLEKLC